MLALSALKENVFFVFYIVNEENCREGTGPWTYRFWVFVYVVDGIQVLRVLFSSRYGWSWAVVTVAKSLNVIELMVSLGSTIPRVVFYAVVHILVAIAMCCVFYISKTYQQGTIKHKFPVKILNGTIAGMYTVFYASCLGWILYPADCGVPETNYFSGLLHGPDCDCQPWGIPEFGFTLLSILVAMIFILFSFASAFLCFEVNPLAQRVRASCTGRVELVWTIVRVLCVVLGLLTTYLPSTICAAIVLLFAGGLMQYHLDMLPYHDLTENIVRGGVYTSVAWSALTSVLISAVADPDVPPPTSVYVLEWICVAIVPVIFCAGMTLVYSRHKKLIRQINMLRREYEISPEYKARADRRRRRSAASSQMESGGATDAYAKQSIFDRFFDLEFEANRAFDSAKHAHLLSRVILLERKKTDIPFLSYVLKRGLTEFPESRDLIILNVLLMRMFVKAGVLNQSSNHERLMEALTDHTWLDHDFVLFASQRGSGQQETMGKDEVNEFQLMEFERKFDKVQKIHRECVLALKTFWQLFFKHKKIFRSKKKYSEHLSEKVEELLTCMKIIETSKEAAYDGYRSLLEKFPRNVSLLRSMAGFCDVALNRAWEASQYRDQALMLETSDESESSIQEHEKIEEDDDEDDEGGVPHAAKSASGSSDGTGRAKVDRVLAQWRESVMSRELTDLKKLHWRIFYATLMICVVCTVGFALTDNMLYEQSAHACINLVVGAQVFRVQLMDALFTVRSLFLAGSRDPSSLSLYQTRLDQISRSFASVHVDNFQHAPTAVVDFYNRPQWSTVVPSGNGWTEVSSSLWSLGNELASQIGLTSGVKLQDVKNWTNNLDGISPSLRAVAYLNENVIQHSVPAFEALGSAYIDQVVAFGILTHSMIWVIVSLNVVLILLVAAHVLRSLDGVIKVVQHERVVMLMVLYSTRNCTQKIFNFYDAADRALTELEEGGIMQVDDEHHHEHHDEHQSQEHPESAAHPSEENTARQRTSVAWEESGMEFCAAAGEGDLDDSDCDQFDDQPDDSGGEGGNGNRPSARPQGSVEGSPRGREAGRRRSGEHSRERGGTRRPSLELHRHRNKESDDDTGPRIRRSNSKAEDTSLESGSNDIVVRAQAIARMKSAPQTMRSLEALLAQRRPWFAQRMVHLVTLVIMLMLCIVSIVYPARNIDLLVNIPAKRNQAGRRRFLHRACVHFARELALDDGMSRLNSSELAAALLWSLEELRAADDAVRLGGTMGVSVGSDRGLGSLDHNAFVYSTGCPWRANYTDGAECTVASRPQMLVHGLYGLLLAFYDACESVLARKLPDKWGDFERPPTNCSVMGPVKLDLEKAKWVDTDSDLAFIVESFDGDLFQALESVESVLEVEQNVLFELVHFEGRLLYAIFFAMACILFYFTVFRNTVKGSKTNIRRTLRFLEQMPIFILDNQDTEVLRAYFQEREYDLKEHEHMIAEAAAHAANAAALGQLM